MTKSSKKHRDKAMFVVCSIFKRQWQIFYSPKVIIYISHFAIIFLSLFDRSSVPDCQNKTKNYEITFDLFMISIYT